MLDNLGSDTKDPKAMSLHLFGKNSLIKLKQDTESFGKYGPEVKGILSGRVWGSQPLPNESKKPESSETVVAIYLKTNDDELTIPCLDIEEIVDL